MMDNNVRDQYTRLHGGAGHEYPQKPTKNQVLRALALQNRNNAFVIAFL